MTWLKNHLAVVLLVCALCVNSIEHFFNSPIRECEIFFDKIESRQYAFEQKVLSDLIPVISNSVSRLSNISFNSPSLEYKPVLPSVPLDTNLVSIAARPFVIRGRCGFRLGAYDYFVGDTFLSRRIDYIDSTCFIVGNSLYQFTSEVGNES